MEKAEGWRKKTEDRRRLEGWRVSGLEGWKVRWLEG
jgi:hypothetical protein